MSDPEPLSSAAGDRGQDRNGPRPWFRFVAAGVWLLYLASLVGTVLQAGGWREALGITALVLFVATYLLCIAANRNFADLSARATGWLPWALVLFMMLCVVATVPAAGDEAFTMLVFVGAAVMSMMRTRVAWVVVAILLVVIEVGGRVIPGWSDGGNGFALVLASLAVFFFRAALSRQRALVAAERELSDARLEEERSRIARDLHDILGHSLTVIAVKTELAERLVDVDPERSRAELADVRALTRDALSDVRATVRNVRGISLPGEIASARSGLESAGIAAELPTVADEVPSAWRELFAWTVREGVTNVIRHSGASRCRVTLSPTAVDVSDDGCGLGGVPGDGNGLAGLRSRAVAEGATMVTSSGLDGRGLSLTVVVPPAGEAPVPHETPTPLTTGRAQEAR